MGIIFSIGFGLSLLKGRCFNFKDPRHADALVRRQIEEGFDNIAEVDDEIRGITCWRSFRLKTTDVPRKPQQPPQTSTWATATTWCSALRSRRMLRRSVRFGGKRLPGTR
jgi:hypothetical protein